MKHMMLMFVFIVSGTTARLETAPLPLTGARTLSFRSIKASALGNVFECCGGPVCIPNEPCGSGG